MEAKSGEVARFIGIIKRLSDGWAVSFRLRTPRDVFTKQGDTDFFAMS
jgi:hypothetical protein